ncbi:MAG: hypothetical protein JSW00_11065 [Thermoplasmata archaeon]|nr:MAG: hypothetical protein JSW00_11065 [Thermoplasmata archaeon]
MSTEFKIGSGERDIIDYFIENNNKMDWISNISKNIRRKNGKIGKDISGIQKYVDELENKKILIRHDCPAELIKKREKGGSKPRDCYTLNYDMKPEWFIEIARPHLNNDDKKIRLKFIKSGFTFRMLNYEKIIDWIIKNHIKIKLSETEKNGLPLIFNGFPSTLRWVLFGNISVVDSFLERKRGIKEEDMEAVRSLIFSSFLNSIIVGDIINGAYLAHKNLVSLEHRSETILSFFDINMLEEGKGEMIQGYGIIPGYFGLKLQDIEITPLGEHISKCPQCKNILIWVPQIERHFCTKCDKIRKKRKKKK